MALAVLPDFSRIVAYGTDVDVVLGLILQVQPSGRLRSSAMVDN